MIVDSSALIALLRQEEDADRVADALLHAAAPRISAANWLEAAIVAEARGGSASADDFDGLVSDAGLEVVAVTADLARRARVAWRRFGRGNHPADLNFGDCFAYALAQERGEPLLFKGEDFARTDVTPALPAAS